MGSSEKATGIPQFNGQNFENWRFRVERHLASADCLEAVNGSAPIAEAGDPAGGNAAVWKRKDLKAQDIITSFVHDDYLEFIREENTAKGMWDSLVESFAKKSCVNQTLIRKELAILRLKEGEDLSTHLLKFDTLLRQLRTAGAKPVNADIVSQLFLTLPESYDAIVTALENLPEEQMTLNTIKSRLLAEESKKKSRNFEEEVQKLTAFTSNEKNFNKAKMSEERESISFMVKSCTVSESECGNEKEVVFAVDLGATDHFVNDINVFFTIKPLPKPRNVIVAKTKDVIQVSKIGDICGTSDTGYPVNLFNVLYSPDFCENLLSVQKIVDSGLTVIFKKSGAVIQKDDGNVVATAVNTGNLFKLQMKVKIITEQLKNCGNLNNSSLMVSRNDLEGEEPVGEIEIEQSDEGEI